MRSSRLAWSLVAIVLAIALFAAALSNAVYEATSPPFLALHVLLRKLYSVVAFALVAFAMQRAVRVPRHAALRGAVLLAIYSAAIEIGQYATGVREGLASNLFDVACGALGGVLGSLAVLHRTRQPRDPAA